VHATNHGAVILTEMPDLPPRPPTPRNAAFRRDFYQRWGRENCLVSGNARRAEYRLHRQTLSLKCVARGTETYFVDRRRVTVSDDTYLVLNEGRVYGSLLESASDAYSFSIFFRPGLAEQVAGDLRRSLDTMLDDGPALMPIPLEFAESLRAHDASISPVLRFIQRQIAFGVRDENWFEEQCQFLLARLIRAQQRTTTSLPDEFSDSRPARRAELLRRLECATDYMHAHLGEEITLADIATAAHLSRFHFLRLYQIVYGRTPIVALRELRTRRALALLGSTQLRGGEVAERVGMSRIAMWRSLRQMYGTGARVLRRLAPSPLTGFLGR